MKESRISDFELLSEMDRIPRGLPFRAIYSLALGAIMSRKGIRYRHRSILADEPPELLPPYEFWRDPCTLDWVIRQGEPSSDAGS